MATIVIIGGSGGLGSKITNHFKNDEKYPNYDIIHSMGSKDLDIRNYKKCKEYFDKVKPDVVINLSGVNFDKFIHKLDGNNQEEISNLLDVNLHGSINIASTCLPGMRERGYGRLIFISSVLATKNVMGTALYSSCKAFLDRFTKSVSLENISKRVTCNSIQLGYFDGGLTEKLNDPEKFKQEIPLKRWGTTEELYNTIQYIIQTEYLTGTNLAINGGL
jgi:NAD(P)-dependent dehydrogenase (short-subunit alcohol dehydrogenase family)